MRQGLKSAGAHGRGRGTSANLNAANSPEPNSPETSVSAVQTARGLNGAILGLLLVLLMASFDQTIVGTAMPHIIAELNGFSRCGWVTTAYLLTSTASLPILGKLSDIHGCKRFYLAGAVLFILISTLLASLLALAKSALVFVPDDVFLIAAFLLGAALLSNFFLPEVTLRRTNAAAPVGAVASAVPVAPVQSQDAGTAPTSAAPSPAVRESRIEGGQPKIFLMVIVALFLPSQFG